MNKTIQVYDDYFVSLCLACPMWGQYSDDGDELCTKEQCKKIEDNIVSKGYEVL